MWLQVPQDTRPEKLLHICQIDPWLLTLSTGRVTVSLPHFLQRFDLTGR
jgi:hypothetical protein